MKKLSQKNRIDWTLKIADIGDLRPWGVAPNPTRDQSLDPLAGSARARPRRKAGKGYSCPFSGWQDNPRALCQQAFAAYPHRLAAAAVFHGPIDNSPAPLPQCCFSAYSGWSAARGKWGAAICRACCRHPAAFPLHWGLCIYCIMSMSIVSFG